MTVRPKYLLVVDDDIDIRDTLNDVLSDEGYAVETAADGIEALERLARGAKPDLILLDWMMPRCDGARFRELQRSDPKLADIPVLLLTADTRLRDKVEAVGAAGCLFKPVNLSQLLAAIARCW